MSIRSELSDVVDAMRAAGIDVYEFDGGGRTIRNWVIVARDGNVGSVQYDEQRGFVALFAVRPNTTYGSALPVTFPPENAGLARYPQDVVGVVEAAKVATRPVYGNWASRNVPIDNHGWEHFRWARGRIIPLAGSAPVEGVTRW